MGGGLIVEYGEITDDRSPRMYTGTAVRGLLPTSTARDSSTGLPY